MNIKHLLLYTFSLLLSNLFAGAMQGERKSIQGPTRKVTSLPIRSEQKRSWGVNDVADVVTFFPKSVEQIKQQSVQAVERARRAAEKIISIPEEKRTFKNTAQAIDELYSFSDIALSLNCFVIVQHVHPKEAMRNIAREAELLLKNYIIDLSTNQRIYKAFESYVNGKAKKEQLTDEQRYFISEKLESYKRGGLNLPIEKINNIKKIKKELSKLEQAFGKNVSDDRTTITIAKEGIVGLDENFVSNLKQTIDGSYILDLKRPTYTTVMENCSVENTRRRMENAYQNRGYPANKEILEQIIKKRDQLAKLLNFSSYCDYDIDSKMVKTAKRAEEFMKCLNKTSQQKLKQDMVIFTKELPDLVTLTQEGKLKSHDWRYVLESYKKRHLNLDGQQISQYFSMESTIKSLLSIYEQFMRLKLNEVPISGLWHEDVKLIAVSDQQADQLLGYLMLDLYPRENKYSHACHANLIPTTYDKYGKPNVGLGILITNFPKPTKEKPSLLTSDNVRCFFHEFGHGLHAILGRTHVASFSGTRVKNDFVELPSIMLENWLKDKEIIKKVSRHYKTGEPLPDSLIEALIKARSIDQGTFWLVRQCHLTMVSLNYFKAGTNKNLDAIWDELHEKILPHIEIIPENHGWANFLHLAYEEYGSKYYTYLWDLVLAADVFEKIKKHGLLNPKIGREYVEKILAPGGSADPNTLLEDFLGRPASQEAFNRSMGLS